MALASFHQPETHFPNSGDDITLKSPGFRSCSRVQVDADCPAVLSPAWTSCFISLRGADGVPSLPASAPLPALCWTGYGQRRERWEGRLQMCPSSHLCFLITIFSYNLSSLGSVHKPFLRERSQKNDHSVVSFSSNIRVQGLPQPTSPQ